MSLFGEILNWRHILSNRLVFLFLMIFLVSVLDSSVIKTENLKKTDKFIIKRDLFNPNKRFYDDKKSVVKKLELKPVKKTEEQKIKRYNIEEEVRNNITYNGYSIKGDKFIAVITVAGETFIVKDNDIVLNKIKILNIGKKEIKIEVEKLRFNIKISGDEYEIK